MTLHNDQLQEITRSTIGHYDRQAIDFWHGTRDHDVSQNIDALLRHLPQPAPCQILELGCGPGRDLKVLREHGHVPVGLDGAAAFCEMAREYSGCEVWLQDFLALQLPGDFFHGIYANASLFHVPRQELPRVLGQLAASLVDDGILFSSNPRGPDMEGWNGDRYGSYHTLETWRSFMQEAGFCELEHYFRPPGRPREEQPWLAMVWRKD